MSRPASLIRRVVLAAAIAALGAPAAHAAAPVAPYGQVGAPVGGFDSHATYVTSPAPRTANLTAGRLVDPVAMVVDTSGPGEPEIYVLDLVDPQALTTEPEGTLDYRIQELTMSDPVPSATANIVLPASTATPDLQAVALAIDPASGVLDVLEDDEPNPPGNPGRYALPAAYQVVGYHTGSLATEGPVVPASTLQPNATSPAGDVDGVSIAFTQGSNGLELAVGGNQYTGTSGSAKPIIERFGPGGAIDATWQGAAVNAARDAEANGWQEPAQTLYGMTADPDGTLNVTLGPQPFPVSIFAPNDDEQSADFEPIMATVGGANLQTTTPVLPAANTTPAETAPGAAHPSPDVSDFNSEIAATDATELEGDPTAGLRAPSGGTFDGGALGPSVVALDGDGSAFPSGLYAGLVYEGQTLFATPVDQNEDAAGSPVSGAELPAWRGADFQSAGVGYRTAGYGIRIFDAAGDSLGMIGDASSGGPCDLTGGAAGLDRDAFPTSMMALAPGAGGTLYALVQPDLTSTTDASVINPSSPTDTGGDEIIEFAPGAGSECPQPTPGFEVDDAAAHTSSPSGGTITVAAGSTLTFDAGADDLAGAVPWGYDWDLGDDLTTGADPSTGQFDNTFTPDFANEVFQRPATTQSYTYSQPGEYTATLRLVDDFGTQTATEEIDVVPAGSATAAFTAPTTAITGQAVSFDASASIPPPAGSFVDYHWDFGDGTSDDSSSPDESWVFQNAGTYTVTLTVIPAVGAPRSASRQITVTPGPPIPVTTLPVTPTTPTTVAAPTATPTAADRSPTTVSPRVSGIRHGRALEVKVSCPATKTSCAGTVSVTTAEPVPLSARRGAHRATLKLGTVSFTLAAGAGKALVIPLSKRLAPALAFLQLVKLKVTVSAHDVFGDAKTVNDDFYLTAPPSRGHHRHFG